VKILSSSLTPCSVKSLTAATPILFRLGRTLCAPSSPLQCTLIQTVRSHFSLFPLERYLDTIVSQYNCNDFFIVCFEVKSELQMFSLSLMKSTPDLDFDTAQRPRTLSMAILAGKDIKNSTVLPSALVLITLFLLLLIGLTIGRPGRGRKAKCGLANRHSAFRSLFQLSPNRPSPGQ
jgi:hypothetical protein